MRCIIIVVMFILRCFCKFPFLCYVIVIVIARLLLQTLEQCLRHKIAEHVLIILVSQPLETDIYPPPWQAAAAAEHCISNPKIFIHEIFHHENKHSQPLNESIKRPNVHFINQVVNFKCTRQAFSSSPKCCRFLDLK